MGHLVDVMVELVERKESGSIPHGFLNSTIQIRLWPDGCQVRWLFSRLDG